MSVRLGEPSSETLQARLRAIHRRFSSSLTEMGLAATPAEFAKVGTEDKDLEKLVMTYEVHGGEIESRKPERPCLVGYPHPRRSRARIPRQLDGFAGGVA